MNTCSWLFYRALRFALERAAAQNLMPTEVIMANEKPMPWLLNDKDTLIQKLLFAKMASSQMLQ
ncbi:hypothetical protein L2729_00085 [Shewanella gelidimarina]|uniref:hypothetical protein n=1 Tax=Shewanella gelidimarina TaxID=56813 RepID=UPI00200E2481|nr:hypothetical protein [Shewanella gelidimarina]MCL1056386.1 hypothetical protein [Shewanella gelidimarina]